MFAAFLLCHYKYGFFKNYFVIGTLIFGLYFTIGEAISLYINRSGYFKEFWNYLDMLRTILIACYCVAKFIDNDKHDAAIENNEKYKIDLITLEIFAGLNGVVWLRIMSLLRLF